MDVFDVVCDECGVPPTGKVVIEDGEKSFWVSCGCNDGLPVTGSQDYVRVYDKWNEG